MFNIFKFYFKFNINYYFKSMLFDYNYSFDIYQITLTLDSKTLVSNSLQNVLYCFQESIFLSTPNTKLFSSFF